MFGNLGTYEIIFTFSPFDKLTWRNWVMKLKLKIKIKSKIYQKLVTFEEREKDSSYRLAG